GRGVGFANTTGADNTFVGAFSDFTATSASGSGDVLLGARARVGADLSNAAAIGYRAEVTQDDSLVLGSITGVNGATATVRVGLGTPAPKAALDVTGGNVLIGSAGLGLILKSPNGAVCRQVT